MNARVTSDGDELFLVDTAMVQSDGSWTQSLHLEMTAGNRFEVARIANRWPLNSIDVTASNLPQEFDRDAEAISFVKGCYLGQETVARIDAIGHVNRRLVAIRSRVPATELEGQELFDPENREKPLGKITSAAAVGDGRTIALAMVRVAGLQPGASWQTPAGAVTLA
jgi:folate-binding protein YgfZ